MWLGGGLLLECCLLTFRCVCSYTGRHQHNVRHDLLAGTGFQILAVHVSEMLCSLGQEALAGLKEVHAVHSLTVKGTARADQAYPTSFLARYKKGFS